MKVIKDSGLGWHLPNQNEGVGADGWDIMRAVPPAAVVLMMGEGVSSGDVKNILQINPGCHVIARWWPCCYEPVETVIEKYISFAVDPGWNDAIPEGQRWLQPWNEPNMRDGLEGYGPELEQMRRFNADFVELCARVRAANPTWMIGFPALTPGNGDVFFPSSSDLEGIPYYMHGAGAAKDDPTDDEIDAAILLGPCYEALRTADCYFAHIYCINDPRGEMLADWCGMRWRYMARFLPTDVPIFINELGISGSANVTAYHDYLRMHHLEVLGTCLYKLRDEPWNYNGGNPAVKVLKTWYAGLPEGPAPPPDPPPDPNPPPPPNGGEEMRARIGVCYTNDHNATQRGREAVDTANIEAVKVMNITTPVEAELLLNINPKMEFLCRLWDGRFGVGHQRPSPRKFVEAVEPGIQVWLPYCSRFEVHNEPNFQNGKEGFGASKEDAEAFVVWYMKVLNGKKGDDESLGFKGLRTLFPDAEFGFPGLVPHDAANDMYWLKWCAEAIEASDFLCVHVYWQGERHLERDWGQRYLRYINKWPNMPIEIVEWGNTDEEAGWGTKTRQYIEWLNVLMEMSQATNIRGSYCYILESHDLTWKPFCWVLQDGTHRPIVEAVGNMDRPPLYDEPEPPPPPEPDPPTVDFYADPILGYAPVIVRFVNTSLGDYDRFDWVFGDGTYGHDIEEVLKTYDAPGLYSVALVLWQGDKSFELAKEAYIEVLDEQQPPAPAPIQRYKVAVSGNLMVTVEPVVD